MGWYGSRQSVQMRRTRRWETTAVTDEAMRNDSMPMSSRRWSADTASVACSDESTKWPVSADCTAIRAVSTSRISPTRMTSGSWRRIDLSPPAKVMPACSLIWIWLIEWKTYSTGSSIVMMLRSAVSISPSEAYSVVVLPPPVGPAQITMPYGERMQRAVALGDVRRHAELLEPEAATGSCRAVA